MRCPRYQNKNPDGAKFCMGCGARLEKSVAQMRSKGRIKVGADADIIIFDTDEVIDRLPLRIWHSLKPGSFMCWLVARL